MHKPAYQQRLFCLKSHKKTRDNTRVNASESVVFPTSFPVLLLRDAHARRDEVYPTDFFFWLFHGDPPKIFIALLVQGKGTRVPSFARLKCTLLSSRPCKIHLPFYCVSSIEGSSPRK